MMALDKKRAGTLIVALIILVAILFAFSKKNETVPVPGAETSVIDESAAEEAAQNATDDNEAREAQDKMRQLIMEQRMEALKRQDKTGK